MGRWTASDPAGLVDGVNLYVYVRGNPVRLHDPSGNAGVGGWLASQWEDAKLGARMIRQTASDLGEKSGNAIIERTSNALHKAGVNGTARDVIMTGAAGLAAYVDTGATLTGMVATLGVSTGEGLEDAGTKLGEGAGEAIWGDTSKGLKTMADATGIVTAGENLGEGAYLVSEGKYAEGIAKLGEGAAGGAGVVLGVLGMKAKLEVSTKSGVSKHELGKKGEVGNPKATTSSPNKAASGAEGHKAIESRKYDRPEIETKSGKSVRAKDAVDQWNEFLGKEQTNIDPRDGMPDPDRIWSQDGSRSIRFGEHEMTSTGGKFHYHMETWEPDVVHNVLQRVAK